MPPNIGRVWACEVPNWAIVATLGTLGALHGENTGQHPVTSCDETFIVTLSHFVMRNPWHYTLQELVTGVGKCFPGSAFHDFADTCNAAEHAVDHVPVIVMAEVLRISQNFRHHNWLEMPHNLSSLVIISYSLIVISFLHPFLNKAAPHRCFFGKNANLPISYF